MRRLKKASSHNLIITSLTILLNYTLYTKVLQAYSNLFFQHTIDQESCVSTSISSLPSSR